MILNLRFKKIVLVVMNPTPTLIMVIIPPSKCFPSHVLPLIMDLNSHSSVTSNVT